MSKDCFPKLKGSICNIPIHAIEINNIQPHGTDSNGLGTVRFKKWAYLGSLFEAVRPKSINQAMLYFKKFHSFALGHYHQYEQYTRQYSNGATANFHEPFDLKENVKP